MAAVVVVSLGVGIGVNTAVFSWIQAMVLQPLPGVADAGRLYLVEPRAETNSYPGVSWPEYRDIREQLRRFRICWRFAWCRSTSASRAASSARSACSSPATISPRSA